MSGFRNAIFLLLLSLSCYGQTSKVAVTRHNLLDIYKLAIKNDPYLAAAKAKTQAVMENVPASRALLLPQVNVSANTQYNQTETHIRHNSNMKDNYNSHGWSANLQQSIFDLKRWFTLKQNKHISEQAILQMALEQQNLLVRVVEAYFNVLRAINNLDTLEAEEKAIKQQFKHTQERYKVGLTSEADTLDAQAAYDNIRVNKLAAENTLSISYEKISEIIDVPIKHIGHIKKNLPIIAPIPNDIESWKLKALKDNLSLKIARHHVSALEQKIKSDRSEHAPTLNLFASYNQSFSHSKFAKKIDPTTGFEFTGGGTQKIVGLQATVPLFSGFATHSHVKSSTYLLEEAEQDLNKQTRNVNTNTRNQLLTVQSNIKQIHARCRSIISANSALKATTSGYNMGNRSITDVLNTQKNLFSSQQHFRNACYDFILNTLRLKQYAGTLNPTDISELNQWITFSKTDDIFNQCLTSSP